ncbi:hypothetical protein PV08_04863 [Exophiala spinifera]|uniref:Magnesium transporter n=1 Tax=Exophiala spinifera TaxID=91928 RepID=A0A0D2BF99_9EURO|nr:uncharacterized protein PV08_04863 [Exophiala spinifera]KIW17668.1 hypothetical protein PV08_04863 [Exophiala spinifera]
MRTTLRLAASAVHPLRPSLSLPTLRCIKPIHHTNTLRTITGIHHGPTTPSRATATRTTKSQCFSTCQLSGLRRRIPRDQDGSSIYEFATPSPTKPNLTSRDTKLTCAYFDKDGTLLSEHKQLTKSKIAEQFELRHRDLRDIDLRSESVTRILIRPATILLQFFDLCMIIQADEALLVNLHDSQNGNEGASSGSSSSSSTTAMYSDFERRMSAKETADLPELPYELRAVEAALVAVLSIIREELVQAKQDAEESARKLNLESGFAAVGLDLLFEHSRQLGKIEQKARLVRDTIRGVLDTDEDLAAMYLSDRKAGRVHEIYDHQEAEYMLEAYHTAADALVESASAAMDVMRKKENTFRSSLDVQRNQIMFLEAKVAIHTLGVAAGTLIAGLFGMNLINYFEDAPYAFPIMTGACVVISSLFSMKGMRSIWRIQKLKGIQGQMIPSRHRRT